MAPSETEPITRRILAAELAAAEARLQRLIFKVDDKFDRLSDELRSFRTEMNGRFDAFLGQIEMFRRETAIIPRLVDQHAEMLRDHEKRIRSMEA